METVATTKGQIVIPSSIRKQFDIKKGTRFRIEVSENNQGIFLRPITRDYINSLRGKYRGKGLMKSLLDEKKKEREL
jgi:AbrB family looped-hinge helix DNA binding protein